MAKSKRNSFSVIVITSIVCFFLGFTTAKSTANIQWVGYLVHGVETRIDRSIVPEPSGFSPKVDGKVVIGLREDGVVVWKGVSAAEK